MGRKCSQQAKVLCYIRGRILSGEWGPGFCLPPRQRLARLAGSSLMTLHSALSRLRAEGFIRTEAKNGTYVAERPPHLFRYVVAFPENPDESKSRFWRCLARACRKNRQDGKEVAMAILRPQPDDPGHRQLADDVAARRLIGIFFAFLPFEYFASPLLTTPDLPRIVVYTAKGWHGLPTLRLEGFRRRGLAWLKQRGRRRIAAILPPGPSAAEWAADIKAFGLTTRQFWLLTAPLSYPDAAANLAHAIMRAADPEPPDGVIIADDNLADAALLGLVSAGAKIGESMDVVAHCNFPADGPALAPMRRLGYDSHAVIEAALEGLATLAAGKRCPQATTIRAVFEDEITAEQVTRGEA